MSFCYQENTHFSQAAQCSRENFWKEIKKSSTRWKIESRRSILQAVALQDEAAINKWLKNEDYQKFLTKKCSMKKEAAKQKFMAKSNEEKLLAYAQELKDNLTAFIFSCREFDANVTAKGMPFRHRRLAGCHLNGLVMLDIDHVDNPMEVWEKLQQNEALFPYYPALQDACKGLKRNQYPAALIVSGALMMTLMTRCTYRFYHRPSKLRRLNASALIIGDPASGKSFATRLYEFLAAPIVAADKAGKDTINRYREEMKTKGANKEKPKKPKVVVRVHPSRTSNAQFIQDMVNAVENVDGTDMQLHMLTFDTELDNTLSVQKGGSWIDKQNLELKAFHNEEDGQAYSNMDSIMQDFNVTWNYVYTGTPIALKKKVNEQNFGSGLATRLTCIPLPSTHFEMMDLDEEVDEDSDNRLLEWAKKLDKTKGELSIKRIVRTMYEWTARRMADAKDNESKADEMLLKRCAYHGINYSAPFIVMRHWGDLHQEGDYWCGEFETDEIDDQLAELIVNIQFACQRHYFGSLAEKYFDDKLRDASTNRRHRQRTIEDFNRLPEEFSIDDVANSLHLCISSARTRVKRLLKDGAVVKCGEYVENGACKHRYKKKAVLVF